MTPTALKQLRRRLGLTQAGLADRIGVQRNTVVRWEMGLNPIPQWAVNFLALLTK